MITRLLTGLVLLSSMTGCGAPEPVATGYKKQIAAPPGAATAATTTGTGNATPATANLAAGQKAYADLCAACHQPLATTAKPNKTLAQIDANAPAKNPSHASVGAKWPTGAAAADLVAALKK